MNKSYTSKGTQKKIDTVTKLTDKVGRAKSIVLADYQGLKHKQLQELRKTLKKVEGEFVITKNRLLRRALGDKAKKIDTLLKKPSAALFAYADEVAPIKELLKYFKIAGAGTAKGGLLGNKAISDAEVSKLASLPTHEVLLAQLAGQLNAPIQGLHDALNWNLNTLVWAFDRIQKSKGKGQN